MANPLIVEIKYNDEIVLAVYDRWGAFDNTSVMCLASEYAELVKGCDAQTIEERCYEKAYKGCIATESDDIEAYEEVGDVIVEIDVTSDKVIVYDIVEITASISNFIEYAERFKV